MCAFAFEIHLNRSLAQLSVFLRWQIFAARLDRFARRVLRAVGRRMRLAKENDRSEVSIRNDLLHPTCQIIVEFNYGNFRLREFFFFAFPARREWNLKSPFRGLSKPHISVHFN